jgi:hypothetical protein
LAAEHQRKTRAGESSQLPILIQVEGEQDGLVTLNDIRDYTGDFQLFKMTDTEHFNVGVFSESTAEAIVHHEKSKGPLNILFLWLTKERSRSETILNRRRMKFADVLTNPTPAGSDLGKRGQNLDATRLVLVIHGIRDPGKWADTLGKQIQAEGITGDAVVAAVAKSYGLFSLLEFLTPIARRARVVWFMQLYLDQRAKYPNAETIDVVAHSFGTYLVCKALLNYDACRFGRVAFAGSVVRRDLDWDEFLSAERVESVRNYQGSSDLIVGALPGLWEYMPLRWFSRIRDQFGSGGFLGFTTMTGGVSNAIAKGGHGIAIAAKNHGSIKEFILHGRSIDPDPKATDTWPAFTAPVVFILGLALILVTGFFTWQLGWIPFGIYAGLILFFLVYW